MRISDWSSDVCSSDLIGFAWSTLLSRTAGISNLLVAVGLLDQPVALVPNFAAVLTGMVYQALPYTILVLYPALARLDNSFVEAALTLGASPLRGFFTVVIPMLRNTIVATLIMARSEEHTSELQPLMRTSYAVF